MPKWLLSKSNIIARDATQPFLIRWCAAIVRLSFADVAERRWSEWTSWESVSYGAPYGTQVRRNFTGPSGSM